MTGLTSFDRHPPIKAARELPGDLILQKAPETDRLPGRAQPVETALLGPGTLASAAILADHGGHVTPISDL